jgi:hypothetical protein
MRIYFILVFLALTSLSSCVTIIGTLMNRDNIITDDRILGQWTSSDSKSLLVQNLMNSVYKLSTEDFEHLRHDNIENNNTEIDSLFITKLYVISYRENNLNYSWTAGLVKIKGQYYLNLSPENCFTDDDKDAYDIGGRLATSSIAKLEWKQNGEIQLRFLNGDQIKEIILNGNARISYEFDPLFDTFVITASSAELSQFLEKYGNNEILYKGGNTIDLFRKK